MVDFNYGKYFYEHKIFDIDNIEERDKMSYAIEDARRIEKYFFRIVPNIEKIREIIAFSFKLNQYLNCLDRINYIRGIIYSQDYIDYNDVCEFYNLLTDYSYTVDLPTIFKEKAYCEENDSDFFDDLMVIDKLYGNNIFSDFITNDTFDEQYFENQDYDEDDNEFDTNMKDCNVSIVIENVINEEESGFINITPKQKINQFKENFHRYVDMILECKKIDENKNSMAYICVILGMTDWFNFIIDKLETIDNITEAEKKCLRNKLGNFV